MPQLIKSFILIHGLVLILSSLLLTGCASSLSETGKVYQVDVTPQMQVQAFRLRKSNPAPSWQSTVQLPEIEELLPLGKDRVLVGFMGLETRYPNSSALSPYSGPYVAFDTSTGQEIWHHEREKNPDLSFNLLLSSPMIVYTSRDSQQVRIVALNSDTGVVVWEREIDVPVASIVADASAGAIVVVTAGERPELTVLDLPQGKNLWSRALSSSLAIVEFSGSRLALLDREFFLLDLRSGKLLANVASGAEDREPAVLATDAQGFFAAWRNGEVNQISAAGKLQWQTSLDGVVELVAFATGKAILAIRRADPSQTELLALALTNGKRQWGFKLAGTLHSTLLIDAGQVFYTSEDKLSALALDSGRRLFQAALSNRGLGRLADHLQVLSDNLVVVSENVVSAHDRKTGKETWRIPLSGVDYLTQTDARIDLTGAWQGQPENALSDVVGSYANNINSMLATSDLYARQARQNYQNVYNRTRMAMSSGSAADRADASFQRSLAASHVENVNAINRSFDSMMLATQTAFNVMASAQAVERNAQLGAEAAARDRALKRLLLAQKIHEAGLQGHYYLRPFLSPSGSGIVVVDLRDGSWAELVTSPAEKILEDRVYLNAKLGLITDEGALVSLGTGLDPDRWQVDERFRAGALSSAMFAFALEDRYRMTLILRSLMAYPFSQLGFQPAASYATKSITKRKSRIIN